MTVEPACCMLHASLKPASELASAESVSNFNLSAFLKALFMKLTLSQRAPWPLLSPMSCPFPQCRIIEFSNCWFYVLLPTAWNLWRSEACGELVWYLPCFLESLSESRFTAKLVPCPLLLSNHLPICSSFLYFFPLIISFSDKKIAIYTIEKSRK